MAEKISVTLDVSKIDKSRIQERTYTNKEGQEVTVKEYKMDVVPLKESRFIKEGPGWKMLKTHFLAQAQTKEEREAKADTVYVGEGMTFERESEVSSTPTPADTPF